MSVNLNVNGIIYIYPEEGDTNWGQSTTQWAQAITSGTLQKAGGSFPLTANVDFGGNFGLIASYYTSRSSNSASSGQIRLAQSDQISFRNATNTGNLPLSVNLSNELTFNGNAIQTITVSDTTTIDLTLSSSNLTAAIISDSITNSLISASAAIAYSKLALSDSILNADINASAAIAYSKLAALTASRALQSNGSGVLEVSSVTSTELGYLSGVTSAVQTQLNARLPLAGGTMTGALQLAADPVSSLQAATKQYVDAAAQGLKVKDPCATATTANITLSGEQTIDGVLTSASRVLVKNQSDQEDNGIYVSAAGAWTRATDSDTWVELTQAYTFISGGTTQAFSGWYSTILAGGTLGTDPVTFAQFSQAGQVTTDGQGIEITGAQLSLELDGTTLSKSGTGLKVNEIANAQIAAAAAIALNKLAATTASRVLVSDGSGFVSASSVTTTTLGYLDASSSVQTQLDAKLTNPMTTNADLITRTAGVPARLGIGSTGQVLRVVAGAPAWSDQVTANTIVSVSGNVTLTSSDTGKTYFVDTSAARSFQLPTPAAGLTFYIKDSTGQSATNNISLTRAAAESIEGVAATKVLQTNWGSWKVMSDGTNWFLV